MAIQNLERFEIEAEIGQGGFSIVYRAHDKELGRQVALKELRPSLIGDEDWVRRFRREARTIAQLDHPHIVPIYDVYEYNARIFLVMRLIEGPSLEDLLLKQGPLPWPEITKMLQAITDGLTYAHAEGVLHRDLKPGNILIDSKRGPMLNDFGLAKITSDNSMSAATGETVVGTPHYIAPEVWEGNSSTVKSDIYALGCIIHEMITGEKVFKGETPPAVMMSHFKPLQLPHTWPAGVPPNISQVLRTALSAKPGERYKSARDLTQAIQGLSGATPQSDNGDAPAQTPSPAPSPLPETRPVQTPSPVPTPPPEAPPPTQTPSPVPTPPPPDHPPEGYYYPQTPSPIPQPITPHAKWKMGCMWSSGILSLVLVTVIVMFAAGICSSLENIVSQLSASVDIGESIEEPITVALPNDPDDIPTLEINPGAGGLLIIEPGATEALVEGRATYNVRQLKPQVIATNNRILLQPESPIGLLWSFFQGAVQSQWELLLHDTPMNLDVNIGASRGTLELGGLSLIDLSIAQGAAKFDLTFSEPNQIPMNSFRFRAGASTVTAVGLANTRAEQFEFDGGAGEYMLNFDGTLESNMKVILNLGFSDMTLIVPEDVSTELVLTVDEDDQPFIPIIHGNWEQVADDIYIINGASAYTLTILADISASGLQLRNR